MRRLLRILCCALTLVLVLCCIPSEIISSAAGYDWVTSWGSPVTNASISVIEGSNIRDVIPAGSTVRTVVTPTLSGNKVRLKFSNEYGKSAVTINEVTIAYTGETDDVIDASSVKNITFNSGSTSVKIAAGSEIYSDEIDFKINALEKVSISCYYKNTTTMSTLGLYGAKTYIASSLGNKTHSETVTSVATRIELTSGSITYSAIPFLSRLDVYAKDAYCVVLLGDSTLTNDIYLMLAEKCIKNGITNIGFVMSGIIGNALLREGEGMLASFYGDSLLERARRDALNIPGVKYIIVKIGINDILHPYLDSMQGVLDQCTPTQIVNGYKSLAEQFKDTNLKVYLCTKTPVNGYTRNFLGSDDLTWIPEIEEKLLDINKWIRNHAANNGYAGYIDFDAVRDPDDSTRITDHMTTDGAHFSSYGQIAATDLIPEAAYGVKTQLTDYADIVGIDPYVAPIEETTVKTEETTKTEELTVAQTESSVVQETTTQKAAETTAATVAEVTTNNPGLVVNVEQTTTYASANQILLGDDALEGQLVASVSDDDTYTKQIAGFALLSLVGLIIVAVASVMLVKLTPSGGTYGRASYEGRAKQKKRV